MVCLPYSLLHQSCKYEEHIAYANPDYQASTTSHPPIQGGQIFDAIPGSPTGHHSNLQMPARPQPESHAWPAFWGKIPAVQPPGVNLTGAYNPYKLPSMPHIPLAQVVTKSKDIPWAPAAMTTSKSQHSFLYPSLRKPALANHSRASSPSASNSTTSLSRHPSRPSSRAGLQAVLSKEAYDERQLIYKGYLRPEDAKHYTVTSPRTKRFVARVDENTRRAETEEADPGEYSVEKEPVPVPGKVRGLDRHGKRHRRRDGAGRRYRPREEEFWHFGERVQWGFFWADGRREQTDRSGRTVKWCLPNGGIFFISSREFH